VKTFVGPDGSIKNSSQTGYALAFTMGLAPANLRRQMADRFVDEVKRFDWHLATGFIGTPRLLPGLHDAGEDDVAYRLLLQTTYPSWLYPVTLGATTIWERWNGWTPEHGFADSGMNSFNHYSLGAVGQYLYGEVAGIREDQPGFEHIRIQPVVPATGLTYASGSYDSIHGMIISSWRLDGDRLSLDVTIPANTTATVYVPARDAASLMESGRPASKATGVRFLRSEGGAAVYEVGSGIYHFTSRR
jgi:alpha-L-rhamnosidase